MTPPKVIHHHHFHINKDIKDIEAQVKAKLSEIAGTSEADEALIISQLKKKPMPLNIH